jgi:hypothetical protein
MQSWCRDLREGVPFCRLEAGSTLSGRFMASIRVQILEVSPPHEPMARSADSFVRAILIQTTRGQGGPRSYPTAVQGFKARKYSSRNPHPEPSQGFKAVQGWEWFLRERFESMGDHLVQGLKARILSGNSHPEPRSERRSVTGFGCPNRAKPAASRRSAKSV